MEIRKLLGRRAKLRRDQLDMTLNDVALECEAAISTIQRIESGQSWPEADLFVRLHEVLRLPVGALVSQKVVNVEPTPLEASELVVDFVRKVNVIPPGIIDSLAAGDPFLWEKVAAVAKGHESARKPAKKKDTA